MEYNSPFRLPRDEYERDVDTIDAYRDQLVHYINIRTNRKWETPFIRQVVDAMFEEAGELKPNYPSCKLWVRNQKTGDREERHMPIDKLFDTVIKKGIIAAPSLTFYLPEHIRRSKLAEFTEGNVAKRGQVKNEMYEAFSLGNRVLGINKKNEQNALKTLNNGSSGAFSSPYTILFNQSAHSVLTSTCRTATSFGNSANERLLGGNRHYDSADRVINYFLSISTLTNFAEFKRCMELYDLHYPTLEEVMEVIEYSSKLYWISDESMTLLRNFMSNTNPLEKAAFVYMGDFYHLAKYNDAFMRGFVSKLIAKVEWEDVEDWSAAEKTIDGDMKIIIAQFRTDIVPPGKSFGDVKKKDEDTLKALPWEEQDEYKALIRSALFLQKNIGDYATLIKNVLTTKNLPMNIACMPSMIRRVGVVSDTDSTMMSVQWWAQWFCGQTHGDEATRVADAMIYVATQHLRHLMASMSVNMGVSKERIFLYAMKNEFKFASFSLTTKAKHYFSIITGQEGQLKTDPELEVKGVGLRTSNIPAAIMREFKKTIKQLCVQVADGDKINLLDLLEKVAGIEHTVVDTLTAGSGEYLKTTNIKDRGAYSDDDEKNYHYHRMYNTIFGPRYGMLDEPPYEAVRLPVNLESKTAIRDWLAAIEDPIIREGATKWFEETNFRTYKTLIIPEHLVSNFGLPPDLIRVANKRRTAFQTVEPYYHVLECLGVFMIDEHRSRLLSDYYGEAIDDDSLTDEEVTTIVNALEAIAE